MKVTTRTDLGGTTTSLVFSPAEQKALRRAGQIADDARKAMRLGLGVTETSDIDHPADTDLAMLAIAVDEWTNGVELDYEQLTSAQIASLFRGALS